MMTKIEQLTEMLRESNRIVFFGGAGVSTASGIPDFRSANGLYNQKYKRTLSPEEMVSHSFFVRDPEDFFDFYRDKLIYPEAQPNDCHKALAALEKELPDLLLLDYEMPEMNGAEVLRQIRSNPKWKDLAVVFLTGTEDKENVRKAESLHPEGFLVKTMGKAGLLMGIAAFFD